jgi:hypothetical protein
MGPAPRSGYALLLVLVTLTICAVALLELTSRSQQVQMDSLERLQGLQTRWGRLSCNRVLLREVATLFEAIEQSQTTTEDNQPGEFPTVLRESIQLGNQLFTIVLADESAKLNLNALRRWGRPGTTTQLLRQALGPSSFRSLRDLERSTPSADLASWGEVFDLSQLRAVGGSDRDLVELTRGLTLWGTGELNLRRASAQSLELACKAVVTDGLARRIVERRSESPTLNTDLLLRQTVLNETDRAQLELILGDGSNAFSVWIECAAGNQRSLQFCVLTSDTEGRRVTESFSLE